MNGPEKGRHMDSTVVTAADARFAWGPLLLAASMRMNGMEQPVVVGAMDWPEVMKRRLLAIGGTKIVELPKTRQCVACQKPLMMGCGEVETEWVCWADADGAFVGDCSEWLSGEKPDEIVIRRYDPVPPDFTPENLEIWRRGVEQHCGRALPESRLPTRVNTAFIVIHRQWRGFLGRWQRQLTTVLPPDVGIVMRHGTAYFQTDESVLASLLAFDPEAPAVSADYKADGRADRTRYFAHFAFNPKPWVMWTARAALWQEHVFCIAEWLVEKGIVAPRDVPLSLHRRYWPFFRAMVPLAPWVWRATKLKRKLFRR